jgi:catechol-2,3-dioxygenase
MSTEIVAKHISPNHFSHFAVRTSRFQEMRRWYQTVLNASASFENDQLCMLTYDEEYHRLALINVPGLQAPRDEAWGVVHVAFTYKTLLDLLATYVRLRDEGITPVRPIHHGTAISMYYKDPDGTAVELTVDAYPDRAKLAAYMETEEFKANPIGVFFDPESLLDACRAGTPEQELMRRPRGEAVIPMGAKAQN